MCMITHDFSVISMTSQASLSLLLLTKVTHAQYRKCFRASHYVLHLYIYLYMMSLRNSDAAILDGDRCSFNLSINVTCILVVSILAFADVQTFSAAFMSVFLRSLFLRWHRMLHCALLRERERERERDGMHCALNNPSVQTELRAGTTRAGRAYPFFLLSRTFQVKEVRASPFFIFSLRCLPGRNRPIEHVHSCTQLRVDLPGRGVAPATCMNEL